MYFKFNIYNNEKSYSLFYFILEKKPTSNHSNDSSDSTPGKCESCGIPLDDNIKFKKDKRYCSSVCSKR